MGRTHAYEAVQTTQESAPATTGALLRFRVGKLDYISILLAMLHVLEVVDVAARPGHQPPVADCGTSDEDSVGFYDGDRELLLEQELGVFAANLGHRLN